MTASIFFRSAYQPSDRCSQRSVGQEAAVVANEGVERVMAATDGSPFVRINNHDQRLANCLMRVEHSVKPTERPKWKGTVDRFGVIPEDGANRGVTVNVYRFVSTTIDQST